MAEVEELGGAYVYLLSDAASYTTSIGKCSHLTSFLVVLLILFQDIPVNGVIGSKCSLSLSVKVEC